MLAAGFEEGPRVGGRTTTNRTPPVNEFIGILRRGYGQSEKLSRLGWQDGERRALPNVEQSHSFYQGGKSGVGTQPVK
jgi:hypothetical protein